jgi:hypothetical protein
MYRTAAGGARPSRKPAALESASSPVASATGLSSSAPSAARKIAAVMAAEAQNPHAAARDARLTSARLPQPPRDHDREQGPVHEEADEVGPEPHRARLTLRGDLRKGERPDGQHARHRAHDELETPRRRVERAREPVEQVREEDERGDQEPLRHVFERRVRIVRDEPAAENDEPKGAECERRPERGAILP